MTPTSTQKKKTVEPCNKHACEEIFQAIDSINYGEVVITIHDGKVVQVEKREKRRFDK
jgi:hypothetical protein